MSRSRRMLRSLLLAAGLGLALSGTLALGGCGTTTSSGQIVHNLRYGGYVLDDAAIAQLKRFHTVFRAYSANPDDDERLAHFDDVFLQVRATYVKDVSDAHLIDAAIKGVRDLKEPPQSVSATEVVEAALNAMLGSLDPYSAYFNAAEWREYTSNARNEFGGLGIRIATDDGVVRVVSPIKNTPAARAGLQAGDVITRVDGVPIASMKLALAVSRMRGEPGTAVKLTIQRPGKGSFDVTIVRAIIAIEPVEWHAEGNVAYIRIRNFNEKSAQGILDAFASLRSAMGGPPRGLVLDLRSNPGGMLDQSLLVADDFLNGGVIVSTRGRNGADYSEYRAEPGDLMAGKPIVVLINSGSASASEIVAGALQDSHRATIMGIRSYGKGAIQSITKLPLEGALKLTTAMYYLPSERSIHDVGVEPDIVVEPTKPGPPPNTPAMRGLAKASAMGNVFHAMGKVKEGSCPAAGPKHDDRTLGCALELLKSGSPTRFLAAVAAAPAS